MFIYIDKKSDVIIPLHRVFTFNDLMPKRIFNTISNKSTIILEVERCEWIRCSDLLTPIVKCILKVGKRRVVIPWWDPHLCSAFLAALCDYHLWCFVCLRPVLVS